MYYIVNYDAFWRHPVIFTDFHDARNEFFKLKDNHSIIEHYDNNYKRKVVWPKKRISKRY